MSSYHNSFNDGPNDKPVKPKPSRTNHPTWASMTKSASKKYNPTDQKVKTGLEKAGVD